MFDESQLESLQECTCLLHQVNWTVLSSEHITYAIQKNFNDDGLEAPSMAVQAVIYNYLYVVRQPTQILDPDPIFLDFLLARKIRNIEKRRNVVRKVWRGLLKKQSLTLVEGGRYCYVHGENQAQTSESESESL